MYVEYFPELHVLCYLSMCVIHYSQGYHPYGGVSRGDAVFTDGPAREHGLHGSNCYVNLRIENKHAR